MSTFTERRVRIGNQTSIHAPAMVPWDYAIAEGFDAFEWFSDRGRNGWCEDDTPHSKRLEIAQICAKHDLRCSVHAPYMADPVTPLGAEMILKSILFAADIGAGVVNIHLFPQHPARRFADSLRPLVEVAAKSNVRISLENTPECSPDDFNAVFGVLSAMPALLKHVGMCLDSGHANLHPATANRYLDYVDQLGEHVPIIHWHAHENWGDRDSHLTLFTGPAATDDRGVRELVRKLLIRGFAGSVVFEQWPFPPALLKHAQVRLMKIFEELRAS